MNTTVEPALIDTQQLDTFIDIGLVGYHDILGDLIREVPVCLDTIRTLIQDGDLPALARRVHSFRGTLACFGCTAMTARLADLNDQTPSPPELASPLLAELEDLWEKSLCAIREWEKSVPTFIAGGTIAN